MSSHCCRCPALPDARWTTAAVVVVPILCVVSRIRTNSPSRNRLVPCNMSWKTSSEFLGQRSPPLQNPANALQHFTLNQLLLHTFRPSELGLGERPPQSVRYIYGPFVTDQTRHIRLIVVVPVFNNLLCHLTCHQR